MLKGVKTSEIPKSVHNKFLVSLGGEFIQLVKGQLIQVI